MPNLDICFTGLISLDEMPIKINLPKINKQLIGAKVNQQYVYCEFISILKVQKTPKFKLKLMNI